MVATGTRVRGLRDATVLPGPNVREEAEALMVLELLA
jgi:hypothetical protein